MQSNTRNVQAIEQAPSELELPPLWCPIEPRIHPEVEIIENGIGRADSPIYEYSVQPSDNHFEPPEATISWW